MDRRVPVRLVWSAVVLSVISMMVFYALVTRGAATRGTSLIYLSPPTTAAMGWLFLAKSWQCWPLPA